MPTLSPLVRGLSASFLHSLLTIVIFLLYIITFGSQPVYCDPAPHIPASNDPPSPLIPHAALTSLCVVSLNCARNFNRRISEFAPSARSTLRSADIICLQECGLSAPILPGEHDKLASVLNWSIRPTFPALLTKDTGIIVRSLDCTVEAFDFGRHWSYLRISLPPTSPSDTTPPPLSIFSVHGPFKPLEWTPIADAFSRLHPDPARPCLIGADWNSVPDPSIDSFNGSPTNIPWSIPETALAPLDVVDSFRAIHPSALDYTYLRLTRTSPSSPPVLTSARRLDSILCSSSLGRQINRACSLHCSSDHRAVMTDFGPRLPPPAPAHAPDRDTTWALHPGLWQSPSFVSAVRAFGNAYRPSHSISHPTARESWTIFAGVARDFLRSLSINHGAHQRLLTHAAAHTAHALDNVDWSSPADVRGLPGLLYTFRSALRALETSASLPFHSRLAAAEMRHSSWLSLASAPSRHNPFPVIRFDGHDYTDAAGKLRAIWSFYTRLYTPPPLPPLYELECAHILTHLVCKIPSPTPPHLLAPFSEDEVRAALRSANRRSSPGPDGLPYRAWEELGPTAFPLLAALTNELGTGAHVDLVARSILLPKKGDPSDLSNYRPISISNAYTRTIARMVAARLLSVGDHLLPWQQAAFLPDRRTALVAGIVQGITDHCVTRSWLAPRPFFIVSLDQQKAYDRVRHDWLFAVLAALGIPDFLINVLKALYHSPATRFQTAEGLTALVRFLCGVLQGDPSSCVVYNITLQPFFDLLRSLGVGILITGLGLLTSLAFADDSLLFFEASEKGYNDWRTFTETLALYERVSNAKINPAKSTFWYVGPPSEPLSPFALLLQTQMLAFGLKPVDFTNPQVHLGHPITIHPGPALAPLLARCASIRARAACFPTLGVSFLSKIRRTKQFLTSRLWHTISIGALPHDLADIYFDSISPYLFSNKRAYVGRTHLTLPTSLGGFGLIDPDTMATALSLSFLRRYLTDPGPPGVWLRLGLVTELRDRHRLPPAALLCPDTKTISVLQHKDTRASGFFGRLLHALSLAQLSLDPSWTQLPWRALLTLPWTHTLWTAAPSLPLRIEDQNMTRYHAQGWITWGDLLWVMPLRTDDPPDHRVIGPPHAQSVRARGRLLPYSPNRQGAVPSIPWASVWTSLPASVRQSFKEMHRELMTATYAHDVPYGARPASWLPIPADLYYADFPWHLLSIKGVLISRLRTSQARSFLRPKEPYIPNWPIPTEQSPIPFYTRVWTELHHSPLDEESRSICLLALGRSVWIYRQHDAPTPCPAGCSAPDSPTHAFVTCPEARQVWMTCMPLLTALAQISISSFEPVDIVGAWPRVKQHRPRLVLWRNAVLVILFRLRRSAASRSHATGNAPDFRHCRNNDVLAEAATIVYSNLSARWAHVLRSSSSRTKDTFIRTWITSSNLVYLEGDILYASALRGSPPPPR